MEEKTTSLRVMLADDHQAVRQGLRVLFEGEPGVRVLCDVGDIDATIQGVKADPPDVLILDLSMPKGGGLAAIAQVKAVSPDTAIVVLTRHRDLGFVRQAIKAGASGYVLKQSSFDELRHATTAAAKGERYVDTALRDAYDNSPEPLEGKITNRERDVLRRASLGHSNKEIAEAMHISVRTVEVHKTQGMRKLGLDDRAALMAYAVMHEWLSER